MAEVTTIALDKILFGDTTSEAIEKANEAIAQAQADANTVVTHTGLISGLDDRTGEAEQRILHLEGALEELEDDIAEAGKVDDVKVNGTSVVDKQTKIANIEVPTYLSDLTDDMQVLTRQMLGATVASLDTNGKVPSNQLPSFVDDVLEFDTLTDFPDAGEYGKIYVAIDTNKTYRFSGSQYTEISQSLALGTTANTAFYGDRGLALEVAVENIEANYVGAAQGVDIPQGQIVVGDVGKEVRGSGKTFVTSIATESSASDDQIPTAKAVSTYVGTNGFIAVKVSTSTFSSATANGLTTFTYKGAFNFSGYEIRGAVNTSGKSIIVDSYINSTGKIVFTVAETKASSVNHILVQKIIRIYNN